MNTKRAIMQILLTFLSLIIINRENLVAQSGTSAAISGNVTDATGAALVDAAVTATDVDTRAVRAGKSNAEGRFLLSQLSPGRYTVKISLPGFAEQVSKPVAVDVGRMVTLNFQLTVSAIATGFETCSANPGK